MSKPVRSLRAAHQRDVQDVHLRSEAAGQMLDEHQSIHRDFDATEIKHKAIAVVIALVTLATCAAWYWSQA